MKSADTFVYVGAGALAVGGLIFSFWPLTLLGIAIAVLYGHEFYGTFLALLFDVILGVPTGVLEYVQFPLVIFALVCFVVRYFALRYVLERAGSDTI
jgi:hypothetical protein